jgi:hypothetical protein
MSLPRWNAQAPHSLAGLDMCSPRGSGRERTSLLAEAQQSAGNRRWTVAPTLSVPCLGVGEMNVRCAQLHRLGRGCSTTYQRNGPLKCSRLSPCTSTIARLARAMVPEREQEQCGTRPAAYYDAVVAFRAVGSRPPRPSVVLPEERGLQGVAKGPFSRVLRLRISCSGKSSAGKYGTAPYCACRTLGDI